jgi:hypothetical protein
MDWWGVCEGTDEDDGEDVPRDYNGITTIPFVNPWCVSHEEREDVGDYDEGDFDDEIMVANDRGGMFKIEADYSNWGIINARPGEQNVCYVVGTIEYFPSNTDVVA